MSRLQEFITKLGRVVIHYAETQTSQMYKTEEILAKPHAQLLDELTSLVHKAVKYETRRSSLNYFIYVINEVKPLVEKDSPLTEKDTLIIKEILKNFLLTLFELLDITKNTEVQLNYNNVETTAPRFISRAWTFHRENVLSIMGTTVTNYLVNNISAKTGEEVSLYVETIINEHQNILLVPLLNQQIRELKEDKNESTLNLLNALKTNKELEQLLTLERERNKEMEQKITLLEKTKLVEQEDKVEKDKTISQLKSLLETQTNSLQDAQSEINSLQRKQEESEETITRLEEENNQLKARAPLANGRSGIYSSLGFFPMAPNLFGRMPLSQATLDPNTNNTSAISPGLNNLGNVE